ncbi:MAG TPA: fibronectin type III domain-containing protein [Solirubrobacterales bacterium]
MRIRRTFLLLLLVVLPGVIPPAAGAETTHKFLKNISLPVNGARLLGVDPQGNIILLAEGAVQKFSPAGEPVNFSALGTNAIDGAGGGNCPATPADCDETPWNSLGPASIAAMNPSKTGPTAGYMYVAAIKEVEPGVNHAQIVAFDPTGAYRGQIDTTQPTPFQSPEGVPTYLSVSPSGSSIIITYNETTVGDVYHADKYQAIDADPAHDPFVGQIRKGTFFANKLAAGGFALGAVADDEVVYVGRGNFSGPGEFHPIWELYSASGFTGPPGDSPPVDLDPNKCECDTSGPWTLGGRHEDGYGYVESVSIDPADHHAFLLDGGTGMIEEWASPTEKVGPAFGSPETIGFASGPMAFDTSGIPSTDGRIYVSRGNSLAVFGPPVPIPNIEDVQASVGHNDATISATIDLDHGPKVFECRVEYGEEPFEPPFLYTQFTPCEPSAPYEDESTAISTDVTGLQTEVSYRARVVVRTNNGVNRSTAVKIRPAAVLDVRTEPATSVTRTTALLNGSLDPDGLPTTYWFEYGIDTNYRQRTAEASAGSGSGSVSADPTEIDNLQPGRLYHFRLVAQNSLGMTRGPDQTFAAASAPSISGVRPSDVGESGATLNARIDPAGFPTTYRFEYGPTASYGQVSPPGGGSVGEGHAPVPVSQQLTGLDPGVTYHFRVVATNEWGTEVTDDSTFNFFPQDCPNAYARQLTRSAYLPDCRAYELVSPGNASAIELYPGDVTEDLFFYTFGSIFIPHYKTEALNLGTARNPSRFSFSGLSGALPGTNPPNSLLDTYTSTRTTSGWVTRYWGLRGNEALVASGAKCDLEMKICIDYKTRPAIGATEEDLEGVSRAPYVWDQEGNSLGRWPTNVNVVKNGTKYIGDDHPSPDFSHYVFSSVNIPFTPDGTTGAPGSAYDNEIEDATVEKVSLLPGGDDIQKGTGGSGETEEFVKIPAVSTDGSHILMTTENNGGVNLYMRVGDSLTYEIAGGKNSIQLIGMTSDGSKVVFASRDHVTPDDTDLPFSTDIYVWEEKTGEITRVSQGNGAGNSNACSPNEEELGPLCSAVPLKTQRRDSDDPIASQSGDVYFYSPEQLDPNNPGVFNEKNLYVYRHGAVKYVATLDAKTSIDRIQISPDGSHVAFLTAARLTGYDNQGWREMYVYNPETGVIRCASCIPTGEPPQVLRPPEETGLAQFPFEPERGEPSKDVMASQSGRFMSDDGRVVFATSDSLVEGDTNGLVDVYEFVGGRPQLISSGTAQADLLPGNHFYPGEYTGVEAISHDGVDVFFSTYDTLAPDEDFNGQFMKFYDARTNGGFPPPQEHLPCVAADECHGVENPTPATSQIRTDAALGSNRGSNGRSAKHKKRHRKRAKARHRRRRHAGGSRAHG